MIACDGCARSRRLVACVVGAELVLCSRCADPVWLACATVRRVPRRAWLQRVCLAATLPLAEHAEALEALLDELAGQP